MRKFRKIRIDISENFYNQLDRDRRVVSAKAGMNRNISFPSYTELLARNRGVPSLRMRGGLIHESLGKKRRRY